MAIVGSRRRRSRHGKGVSKTGGKRRSKRASSKKSKKSKSRRKRRSRKAVA